MGDWIFKWLLVILICTSMLGGAAAYYVNHQIEQLQGNICAVTTSAHASAAKDAKFWSAAAARARTRALTDTGNAKAADLDSAAADHKRAVNDINATQYRFPGC